MGFFGCMGYTQGGMGIFNIPTYINSALDHLDMTFYGVLVGIGVAMVFGFLLTCFFGVPAEYLVDEDEAQVKEEATKEAADELIKQEVFNAPVAGEVVALEDVADEVFAFGSLGRGVAVKPSEGVVVAPADGVVTAVFPAGHAVGITTASGAELLIHIGIYTVQLEGKGFTKHVAQGDKVKRWQKLVAFDRDVLAAEGYDDTVMMIVSNTDSFQDVVRTHDEHAATDRELLAVAV